jgi:hypothetical protein
VMKKPISRRSTHERRSLKTGHVSSQTETHIVTNGFTNTRVFLCRFGSHQQVEKKTEPYELASSRASRLSRPCHV